MCLSSCNRCQYFTSPLHPGNVGCSVRPHYWWLWFAIQKLDSDAVEVNSLPIDSCPDFDLLPELVPVTIALTLTPQQWQALASSASDLAILEQIATEIELDLFNWVEVDSSCMQAIAYSSSSSKLKVRFHTGVVYQYDHVPSHVFRDLREADSQGSFFHHYIKNIYSSSLVSS